MAIIIPDHGYAWVVMMASFVGLMIESGLRPCLGIFSLHLIEEFNTGNGNVATVFSMANAVTFLAGPIVSITVSHIGLRWSLVVGSIIAALGYALCSLATTINQVIIFAVLIGFGSSFIRMVIVAAQPYYFTRYRNLAMGFVMVGPGVGAFVLPPLLVQLIKSYTWRGAMLLSSGLLLQCLIVAALLFQVQKQVPYIDEKPKSSKHKLLLICESGLWADPVFTLQGLGLGFAAGCGYIYFSMIIPLMVMHGVSQSNAAYSFAIQGVFQLVGRLCGTVMMQGLKHQVPLFYAISLAVGMSTEVLHLYCTSFWSHTFMNAMVGVSNGMFFVTMAPFMVDAFGVTHLTLVLGFVGLYNGVGGIAIPKLGGEMADRFGLYSAFYVAAISGAVAVLTRRNNVSPDAEPEKQAAAIIKKLTPQPVTHTPSEQSVRELGIALAGHNLLVPTRSHTVASVHSTAPSIVVTDHDGIDLSPSDIDDDVFEMQPSTTPSLGSRRRKSTILDRWEELAVPHAKAHSLTVSDSGY